MRAVRSLAILALASLPPALAQVPLAEVAKIARARAERSRPAQQKALEPYWADLQLDYGINREVLDGKIAQVAALGDNVVPLLLEKLAPTSGGETARQLAGNCRRVLERLDPASFLDALVELANGSNETGRNEAVRLLGAAQSPQATAVLTDLLDRNHGEDKRLVVRALRQQKAAGAAAKIVPMLASSDPRVREDVLAYLVAAKPAAVADTVVQALANEKDAKLLPAYIDYFAGAVKGSDTAARALLPLLDKDKLGNWQDQKRLVQALATVAPTDHDVTCRRLHELLDTGDTTSLAVQAALTLRALGDKQGVAKLKRTLDAELNKPKRREDVALYEQRANLLFAMEEYGEALHDFEKALQFQDGLAMQRKAYIGQMRCEARRKRFLNLTKLMKASGMTVAEIEAIGAEDTVFAETLQKDTVRTFLTGLAKDQAPK